MRKLRSIGFGSRLHEPSNPDYLAQKHKLDHLAAFLSASLQVLKDTMSAWTAVATQQSHFAALVGQAGLPSGTVRGRCARAAKNTAKCASDIRLDVMQSTVVPDAMEQLRRFLNHVTALQERYKDVRKMKREYDGTAHRLRVAQGKLGSSESLARAQAKHDRGRLRYEGMVKRMAERMADANRRMPDVVRTVHYLYWLLQDKATEKLLDATEAEMKLANAAEPALCYITFCHGLRSPASIFHTLDSRSGSRRK